MLPYGYALSESGRRPDAWTVYEELDERATALGHRGLAARARLAGLEFNDFDPETRATAEKLIGTFAELGDEVGLAEANRGLGAEWRARGRIAAAAVWFERALVHASAGGDLVTRRLVTQSLSMALCHGPMPVPGATARCEELRSANRGDRVLDAVIARHLSSLYAMAGHFEDACESWEWASLVLDEANVLVSSWVSQVHAAGAKELAGDREGAERDLKAMWLHCRDALGGAPDLRAMHAAYRLAYLYCDEGRWDDAEEYLAFCSGFPALEDATVASYRPAAAARLAAHRGDFVSATALADQAVEAADATDMLNMRALVWLALAEVRRVSGRAAEADDAVATALELYERKGNVAAATRLRAGAVSAS
jgi:tetratricopeptide (TPR) repeat protein